MNDKRAELQEALHALALLIGLRPAARKLGINEKTATVWAFREKWNLSKAFAHHGKPLATFRGQKSKEVSIREAVAESLAEQSEDTRLYLSATALKASHDFASRDPGTFIDQRASQALLNVSKTGDTVHGWTAQRQQGTQVQVAVVNMPSAEERAERKQMHNALDAIARSLKDKDS